MPGLCRYGCGRATNWVDHHSNGHILAVDSSPAWIAKARVAATDQAERITIEAIDLGELGDWGYPTTYRHRHRFRDDVHFPWQHGSVKPDLVLIDGRFRVDCFLHSLLSAEPGPPRTCGAGSGGDRAGAGGFFDGAGLRGWSGARRLSPSASSCRQPCSPGCRQDCAGAATSNPRLEKMLKPLGETTADSVIDLQSLTEGATANVHHEQEEHKSVTQT